MPDYKAYDRRRLQSSRPDPPQCDSLMFNISRKMAVLLRACPENLYRAEYSRFTTRVSLIPDYMIE